SMPMIVGTGLHFIRFWISSNAPKIAVEIGESEDSHKAYDIIKRYRMQAIDDAIKHCIKKADEEGLQLTDADKVYLENALIEDGMREAVVEAMTIRASRSYWIGYELPRTLSIEASYTRQKEIRGVLFEITGHPDAVFTDGLDYFVYDYKSGRPAPMNDWIYQSHRFQLNGYAWLLQGSEVNVKVGAVNYINDFSMFRVRIVLLDPYRVDFTLERLADWVTGSELPEPCYHKFFREHSSEFP